MFRTLLIGAAASLFLTGCAASDEPERETSTVVSNQAKQAKFQKEIDPEAYRSNIASAMDEIPPSLKAEFQALFICEVRKNNNRPDPKPIDADYVRALTAHLQANPEAAANCTI